MYTIRASKNGTGLNTASFELNLFLRSMRHNLMMQDFIYVVSTFPTQQKTA
ncbi:hypothetical protein SK128_020300 [Halocaridina rubra]|uniref:Uncharacterized protein n=1 Tax=Halocaridina rubra TaxID=373956 RepID=A0AAN8WH09_HALRR